MTFLLHKTFSAIYYNVCCKLIYITVISLICQLRDDYILNALNIQPFMVIFHKNLIMLQSISFDHFNFLALKILQKNSDLANN